MQGTPLKTRSSESTLEHAHNLYIGTRNYSELRGFLQTQQQKPVLPHTLLVQVTSSENMSTPAKPLNAIFAKTETTVFEVMSKLSMQHKALNLGQGYPGELSKILAL